MFFSSKMLLLPVLATLALAAPATDANALALAERQLPDLPLCLVGCILQVPCVVTDASCICAGLNNGILGCAANCAQTLPLAAALAALQLVCPLIPPIPTV